MEDPRYPVGEFTFDAKQGPERRARLMTELLGFGPSLRGLLRGLSGSQLDTPYREGGWSTRQIAHHTADSALNMYLRIKLGLTEKSPRIVAFDQDAWAVLTDATTMAPEVSVSLLESVHARIVAVLRCLPTEAFARTVLHPERGEISVDYMLQLMHWHARHHVAQIEALRQRKEW
jgi:hypothetical protein